MGGGVKHITKHIQLNSNA